MATDITTLAIAIQSQEAERNLQTFNALMLESSKIAAPLEKITLAVDASAALAQIQALKTGYDDLASSIGNLNGIGPGVPDLSAPNMEFSTEGMEAMKEFFAVTAEMSKMFRDELAQLNAAMQMLEANAGKVGSAGGNTTATMSEAAAVSREYAAKVREVAAAQKELEKAVAQADAAMKATAEADEDAEAVKKRLEKAQRELAQVSKQLAATHRGMGGDIIKLSEREEYLKNKVAELKNVYEEAKAAAEKFNQKLEESGEKADAARQRYQELKAQLDAMPKTSFRGASESVQTFAEKAKLAGAQLTKLGRGFNSIAMLAGGAIPGVSGLGRAISMFGMVNPYVAAAALAIGACVAVYKEYDKVMQDTAVSAREMAEEQAKLATSFKREAQERQSDLDRLAVLNSYETLYDGEKEESRIIVEKLTRAYQDLGIEYDKLTGKVSNLTDVSKQKTEQDRQRALEKQKEAVEMARSAAATQLEESARNSVGWFKNLFTGFMGFSPGFSFQPFGIPIWGAQSAQSHADEWYDYIKNAKDLEDQIKRVNKAILYLDQIRQKGGNDAWALDAADWSEQLKKARTTLLTYQEQYKKYREIQEQRGVGGGRSQEDIDKSLRADEEKLKMARLASMSASERNRENIAALEELNVKKQEFAALDQTSNVVYRGEKIPAAQALLKIETEITNRTRERLAYEKKLEAEKAKLAAIQRTYLLDDQGNVVRRRTSDEQAKMRDQEIQALRAKIDTLLDAIPARRRATGEELRNWGKRFNPATGKMDGEQKQAGWRGILPDGKGGVMTEVSVGTQINGKEVQIPLIVPDSTEEDLRRIAQIANGELTDIPDDLMEKAVAFAKKRINAGKSAFYNGDAEDEALRRVNTRESIFEDLKKFQTELVKLQGEQLSYREANKNAKQRLADARKDYVFDRQGNMVRRKTEAERLSMMKQEIAAQKAKVKATTEGSTERYQEQQKLDAMQQKYIQERMKNSAPAFAQQQIRNNSTVVQGIQARSSEALRLQARNFNRPENGFKDIGTSVKSIYDELKTIAPDTKTIADKTSALVEMIETV